MRVWDAQELIGVLEGEFGAAIAGADDVAARDLAFSLAQDVPVVEDLRRDGGSVCVGDVEVPITRLGHDYLEAGAWIVPLDRAVVMLGDVARPAEIAQVFLGRLRMLARARARVATGVRHGRVETGIVEKATTGHLVVKNVRRRALPLAEIDYVRLVPGGSEGAP